MGLLVEGKWVDEWYDTESTGGHFVRTDAQFRHWITPDGQAGPTGDGGFKAEPGRYHLYVSLACPWAHRTLIFRALKGLQDMISVSVVQPYMGANGWSFAAGADSLFDSQYLYQVYLRAQENYTGRVTVPLLWDRQQNKAVSNESAEIIRMLNSAFDSVGARPGDYYPEALQADIDAINHKIYHHINNGVYKAGFATEQSVYETEVKALFDVLTELDQRLANQRYLLGEHLTEADWRLFTTLVRFDAVYHGHFKCNIKRLVDFPHLWAYTRELYQWPGVAETVDMEHIKAHYYGSHPTINPNGIIPLGPETNFNEPHGRGLFPARS